MTQHLNHLRQALGPRPDMTLIIQDQFIREIWVNGRAPIITIHDYDWGGDDPNPSFDEEGFAYSPIRWRAPAWQLGLSAVSYDQTWPRR